MNLTLDAQLCAKYPKIFANQLQTPEGSVFGFGCGPGWYDLIDSLCGTIQAYIDHNSKPGKEIEQVVAVQVKEKFGTLRFYVDGGDTMTEGMIWFAESFSDKICEECGSRGTRRKGGWVRTLCDTHEAERQAAK
jgi:hypothetical protein